MQKRNIVCYFTEERELTLYKLQNIMKVNYMKTRFNNEVLHVAFDEDSLTFIRCTDANSGKEVVLDNYDSQIMNERIVDYISDLN